MSVEESLAGVWELASFYVERDGARTYPFGEDAGGRIVYDPGGWMSAVLMRRTIRSQAPGYSLEKARHASLEEKANAYDGYLSYSGRWHLERDGEATVVVHTVDLALVPTVIGSSLRRRARLEGDELVLDYETYSSRGTRRHFVLRWRRP
ncbi:MAG: lipocalin-like domain-containing protein [Myxococcota bacterium]